MKKLFLSATVVFGFIFYGLHQQKENASAQIVDPKNTSFAMPTADSTPTDEPSPTPEPSFSPTITPTSPPTTPPPTPAVRPTQRPTSTPISHPAPQPTPTPNPTPMGRYKNGNYTGSIANAYYGNVQVQVAIQGQKLSSITFLQYPNSHPTSVSINMRAMPILQQEAIQAQSAQVNGVSGASLTSQAFIQSLNNALTQAS